MDYDTVHTPIESGTYNMKEINEVEVHKNKKRKKHKNAVTQCPDPEDSSTTPVIRSENEEITETSARNKNQTTNLTPLEDQNYRSINQSRRSSLSSIPSDLKSSLSSIPSEFKASCCYLCCVYCCMQNFFKKPTAEIPKQDVDPRTLTKKQTIKIIALRLLMILHTFLTIWRVTVEKNNPLYWILTLSIMLQILEGLYSWHSDRRIKKRWRPCFLVYFASVIPSFWILQYEQHFRIVQGRQENSTCGEDEADGILDAIRSLDCLKSSTWFVVVLETFAYVLLIGRLLHDSMTQSVMTQQMLGFLASSADIMEFFSLFEEEKVAQNSKATLFVLVFWTFSFFQFIPIWGSHKLGKTETKLKALPFDTENNDKENDNENNKGKYYLPFFRLQNKCSWYFDDSQPAPDNVPNFCCPWYCANRDKGDSTERYETGLAYVFQDGPFLVLRVYFIFTLNLFTQSMFFFSLKNFALSVLLLSKFKCDFFNFLSLSIQIAVIVIIVGIVA